MLFAVLFYFPFLLFSKRLWKPEFHVQRLNSSGLPGMWTLFIQGVRSHASIFDGADQMADLNFKQSKIPYGWNPACIFRKLLCMPFLCHRLDELHEEHFQNMQLFDALLMHVTSPLAPDSRILITCTSQKTVPPKSIPFRLQPIQSILPYTHTRIERTSVAHFRGHFERYSRRTETKNRLYSQFVESGVGVFCIWAFRAYFVAFIDVRYWK